MWVSTASSPLTTEGNPEVGLPGLTEERELDRPARGRQLGERRRIRLAEGRPPGGREGASRRGQRLPTGNPLGHRRERDRPVTAGARVGGRGRNHAQWGGGRLSRHPMEDEAQVDHAEQVGIKPENDFVVAHRAVEALSKVEGDLLVVVRSDAEPPSEISSAVVDLRQSIGLGDRPLHEDLTADQHVTRDTGRGEARRRAVAVQNVQHGGRGQSGVSGSGIARPAAIAASG